MGKVRKAREDDFDKVLGLLLSIGGASIDVERWKRLFTNHWNTEEDYFGYVLMDGERAVGFLGMIFSRRKIGALLLKVCNLTSWVVEEKFRTESLKLIEPIAQMNDYLITNFTAQKKVSFILKRYGFNELDKHWIIIPPIVTPSTLVLKWRCKFITDVREIEDVVIGNDLQLFEDHKKFQCGHIVIQNNGGYCYIVYHRSCRKGLPFAYIDHISDTDFFLKHLAYLRIAVAIHARAVAIIVDERLLKKRMAALSFRRKMPGPSIKIYRCGQNVDPAMIDNMYSELVLLRM